MAQSVSRRSLNSEARVGAQINPCGICGGQSGIGTGFSMSSSVVPCQYIIPPSHSALISSENEQYIRSWQQFRDVFSLYIKRHVKDTYFYMLFLYLTHFRQKYDLRHLAFQRLIYLTN
jgi:hypothetical protein